MKRKVVGRRPHCQRARRSQSGQFTPYEKGLTSFLGGCNSQSKPYEKNLTSFLGGATRKSGHFNSEIIVGGGSEISRLALHRRRTLALVLSQKFRRDKTETDFSNNKAADQLPVGVQRM
jgi:hypothetical protein